ncbi:MAG: ABC transporter permease, partial [Eubacteriaceae bacterium]|nr:ABC transporter permease [Eubacteriaceae bacterium]
MKSIVFAGRVGKEIRRDPLSYIFCLGFPIVMLVIMSIVDSSIPPQANMRVFHIENLAPGIAYFGLTFVMLFTGIQVSKDRTTALLLRLYASPMKASDYVIGYTLPVLILGLVQMSVCFAVSFVVGMIRGYVFSITSILFSMLMLIPSLLMFAGIGILFGSAVSDKAAPGLCSIIISAVGMIGGIWMDIDGL